MQQSFWPVLGARCALYVLGNFCQFKQFDLSLSLNRHTCSPARRTLCTSAQRCKHKRRPQNPHTIVQKKKNTHTHEDTRANLQTHENAKHKRTRRCTSAKSNVPILNWKTSRKNLPDAVFTLSSPDPLCPSLTETKRMIEHQSPTVTQGYSIIQHSDKPRRLRCTCLLSSQSVCLCCSSPRSGWVCHWKPLWIPVGDSWKKALMEEWVFISDEHTDE